MKGKEQEENHKVCDMSSGFLMVIEKFIDEKMDQIFTCYRCDGNCWFDHGQQKNIDSCTQLKKKCTRCGYEDFFCCLCGNCSKNPNDIFKDFVYHLQQNDGEYERLTNAKIYKLYIQCKCGEIMTVKEFVVHLQLHMILFFQEKKGVRVTHHLVQERKYDELNCEIPEDLQEEEGQKIKTGNSNSTENWHKKLEKIDSKQKKTEETGTEKPNHAEKKQQVGII